MLTMDTMREIYKIVSKIHMYKYYVNLTVLLYKGFLILSRIAEVITG